MIIGEMATQKSDLKVTDVVNQLASISSKWNEIGIALDVDNNELASLRQSSTSDVLKLSQVISIWHTENPGNATWDVIISAVEGPIVGNKRKANEIRQYLSTTNNTTGDGAINLQGGDDAAILKCKPKLVHLLKLLSEIKPRYNDIGNALNVPMATLGLSPYAEYHSNNLVTTLNWWIDNGNSPQTNSPVTWGNIIDKIEGPIVQNYEVATKMREFLKKENIIKEYLKK